MTSSRTQNWTINRVWWWRLIAIVLIIGIFFRVFNLDRKIYWEDETYSSLRISGYTAETVIQDIYKGQLVSIQDLQKYQQPNPEKGLEDTIKALAGNPEHSPLYYLMARFLVRGFGHSIALMRGLAAAISLLAFPCIYWLCLELFESSLTGWVAIALLAVSPFHVLYAQEAREYSLFVVTILLSSASLLRAIRVKTTLSWALYAATVTLGIYSHLLFTLVAIGHAIYVAIVDRLRFSKTLIYYLLASAGGILAFCPWLFVVIANYQKIDKATSWTSQKVSLFSWVASFAGNLSRLFLDFNMGSDAPLMYLLPLLVPILAIAFTIFYSIYFLCRNTPLKVWLFVLTASGVTAIFVVGSDLIVGGQRSTVPRYLIPCYLGIQLSVAYLLAAKMNSPSVKSGRRKLWQIVAIALLSSGVLSCAIASQAQLWWNKGSGFSPEMVRIINQATKPLAISDEAVGSILSLSYVLDPKVRFQLVVKPNVPEIPNGFSDIFLYSRSQYLRSGLEQEGNYKIEPVRELGQFQGRLWRLEK